jgi:hypothetical protein
MEPFSIRRTALSCLVLGLSLAGCGPSPSTATPADASPSGGGNETTTETPATAETSAPADTAAAPASEDAEIREAITLFLTDPAKGDPGKITRFVNASPKVLVVFRESLLKSDDASPDLRTLMLTAFAAGNAAAQLDAGKKEDMPVAGVKAMVAVYRKVQAANASIKATKYEDFAQRADKGTLDAHVTELVAKETAKEKK